MAEFTTVEIFQYPLADHQITSKPFNAFRARLGKASKLMLNPVLQ